jgi:hypothetical protein
MISIYGLFADHSDVRHELDSFAGILPAEEMQLLADQMNSLVQTQSARFGIGFVVSLSIALWIAMSATTGLMHAACDEMRIVDPCDSTSPQSFSAKPRLKDDDLVLSISASKAIFNAAAR